jgi:hypothetical protein
MLGSLRTTRALALTGTAAIFLVPPLPAFAGAVLEAQSTVDGIVLNTDGANPIVFNIGNAEAGRFTATKGFTWSPAFQSGNPGNASVYGQLANPATIDKLYNGLQFSVGPAIPASEQFGNNSSLTPVQQGIVGTVVVPPGDTTSIQNNGIAGYCRVDRNLGACVGAFGQVGTSVANSSIFGANFIAQNINASVSALGFDTNYIAGMEINPNLWQKSPGVNPSVNGPADDAHFYGLNIQGGGNHTNEIGSAIVINNSAFPAPTRWASGLRFNDGSAIRAITIGAVQPGSNQPSMSVVYNSKSAGGSVQSASTFTDQNGSYYMVPAPGGDVLGEDGFGHVTFISEPSAGGSMFRLPLLGGSGGVVTNDATGLLSSVTTLPSGLTLPGATITGGQINNVVIGASTPLAVTGTTIAANTSFTAPNGSAGGYILKSAASAADSTLTQTSGNILTLTMTPASGVNKFQIINSIANPVLDYNVSLPAAWSMTGDLLLLNSSGISVNSVTSAGAGNILLAGILKYTTAATAVSGAGPFLVGSASTLNSRIKVNMNGVDYWIPASTTAF